MIGKSAAGPSIDIYRMPPKMYIFYWYAVLFLITLVFSAGLSRRIANPAMRLRVFVKMISEAVVAGAGFYFLIIFLM